MADTDTMPQEGTDQLVDESGEQTSNDSDNRDSGSEDGSQAEPQLDDTTAKQIADLRRENASWRTKLRDAEARLQQASTDAEEAIARAREEARQEAYREALAESNERILRAEVIAAAARKLADPEDAVRLLDLTRFSVNDKGEVDRRSIAAAVDELVRSKPYLAATRDPDFGARPPAATGGPSMDDWIRQAARGR